MDTAAIYAQLRSKLKAAGLFDPISTHEPKSAPAGRVYAALWLDSVRPVAPHSGLAATSARLEFKCRLGTNMLQEPQDAIDPALLTAADTLLEDFTGDFQLAGVVAAVDVLGAYGDPLEGVAGYVEQDGKMYRVLVLTIPLIINDAWTQTA